MLRNAIFYDNEIIYKKNQILSFDVPNIFKLEKETIIIIHNTDEIKDNEIYKFIITNKLKMSCKIIYTSNIEDEFLTLIDKL